MTPILAAGARRLARLVGATLLVALPVLPCVALAQPRAESDEERDRQFIEILRRNDPAEADRWVALRDARARALSELREAENQYGASGPALRSLTLPRLTQARQKYAEASLAVLDFLDGRDRRTIENYQDGIKQLNRLLEDRQKTRAELEKLLPGR